jgi:hypothetical protein
MSEPISRDEGRLGQAAGESVGGGSDVKSSFSFAPALRTHQRAQRRNGANRCQQYKTGNEEKPTLHVLHRERPHHFTPILPIVPR